MKIKNFEEFKNVINEDMSQSDKNILSEIESALTRDFEEVTYLEKDKKRYDYDNGYVEHHYKYRLKSLDWLDRKSKSVFLNNNFDIDELVKFRVRFYESISDAEKKYPHGVIGVVGDSYFNFSKEFNYEEYDDVHFGNLIKEFKRDAQNAKDLPKDLIDRIFWFWDSISSKEANKKTSHVGIGSHASTIVYKEYEKVYKIQDLNKALNMSREETERAIKNHGSFKRDELNFHWDDGILVVNGEYSEKYD